MLRFFTLCLFFSLSIAAPAQTHTPRYVSMTSKTNGYYEYLPEGYDANGTATYPLILFMTGIGEFGNGSVSQLPLVLRHGVPKEINDGVFPSSFTVGGQVFRFIVITPQFVKDPRPEAEDMDSVLNYVVAHYKVDVSRIYITGLSYGGGLTFSYAGNNAMYAQRVAAIVPVASPVPDGGDTTIEARSRIIAANNVAVWATHNQRDHDDTVATTITYINDINQPPAPTPPARITLFNASGHNAWDRTYDPARKEFAGMSVYEWLLQYHRGAAAVNQPPTANAGVDQSVTLPANSVTLNGTGSDNDGSITAYAWTKLSGPAAGTITSPAAAGTSITGLVQGTYVFRLTVTDNNGATGTDDVTVTVNAAPNQPPVVNAGADQTITLPVSNITLTGTVTDDGTIVQYTWTQLSGPTTATIATPDKITTTLSGLVAGTYTFRLTAKDNAGATAYDDVVITVNAAANKTPVAYAGTDVTITLPTSQVNLTGSGTDEDGTIASYAWTQVSGPAGAVMLPANAAATSITGLVQGSYVLRLTVTDNDGATASDDVSVTVNAATAANQPPVVNAGADRTITLPQDSVVVNGTATDPDGSIAQYTWTKVSGPGGETVSTPAKAATAITGLTQGIYVFRLTATDNKGATASDDVTITVLAAPVNHPPHADAGLDQHINLPTNTTTLHGAATDSDGTIATYHWTKISGPAGGTIATPNGDSTVVTDLQQGTYVFRFTVADNKGDTASDDVSVTVSVVTAIGDDPAATSYKLIVAPNPTTTYFSLKLLSPSTKPASLQVSDAVGRTVEQQTNIQRNTVYMLGSRYPPGTYYVQVIQAGRIILVKKLLKLP